MVSPVLSGKVVSLPVVVIHVCKSMAIALSKSDSTVVAVVTVVVAVVDARVVAVVDEGGRFFFFLS
jgi:hypothetical protein